MPYKDRRSETAALKWSLHLRAAASFTYLFNRLIVRIIGEIVTISLFNVIAFIIGAVHLKLKLGQLKVLRELSLIHI